MTSIDGRIPVAKSTGEREAPLYPATATPGVMLAQRSGMVWSDSTMPPRTRQTQAKPDEIGNEDVVMVPQSPLVSGNQRQRRTRR
ncbi:unnamed protein product [Fusarium venenatum]|uniref:Uncharacterized protein n=1 Tax=Fusarium venenatum TaxID=56646 RepID=A0A2L2T0Q6_9HYPO|nr:uncharacterized protein FVRRES_07524 [Fusarium venenatum]CEI63088.1 unnamed protein product [Fusarium venenatum]